MASSINETVSITFLGNDQLSSAIRTISSNFNAFDDVIQSAAAPAASITKSLLALETGAIVATTALVALSVAQAGEFKDAAQGLGALFNANAEQVDDLSGRLLEFSKTSVASFEQIQKASFIAISTGTEQTQVTEALAAAQKLAVAGSTDLVTATAAISRTLNAYGLEASEATSVSDALFLAAQKGDTDLTLLANSIGNVASTASASGVGLDQLLSSVSAVTIAGISTEQTMTKLGALFLELASPSDELTAALGGISLESDGLQAVTQRLQQVTGGATVELNKLFSSSEALSAATILARDSAGKFNETLTAMASKTGIVEQNYERLVVSFKNSNQLLTNNLRAALVEIGTPLLDEYNDIAGAVSSIFNELGLSVKSGGLRVLTEALEDFAKKGGQALEGIAKALPEALDKLDFTELLNSLSDLGGEFSSIFDELLGSNLDLSKPQDLAKALQRAVDIVTSFVQITKGIVSEFKPIFELIGKAASEVGNASSDTTDQIGKVLGALTLLDSFGTKIGGIIVFLDAVGADFSNVFEAVAGSVIVFINVAENAFLGFRAFFLDGLLSIVRGIESVTIGDTNDRANNQIRELEAEFQLLATKIVKNNQDIADGTKRMADSLRVSTTDAANDATVNGKKISDATESFTDRSTKDVKAWESSFSDDALRVSESAAGLARELTETDFDIVSEFGVTDLDAFNAKIKELTESGADFSSEWSDKVGGEVVESVRRAKTGVDDFGLSVSELAEVTRKQAAEERAYRIANGLLFESYVATEKAVEKVTKKTGELSDVEKLAADNTQDLKLKLLDLASDDRLARLEFRASIEVAGIEADASKIVALFDSVAETVTAVSDTVASEFDTLAGAFADGDIRGFDLSTLERRFNEQVDLQKRTIETQEKAVDSQIELDRAKIEALRSGSQITITNLGELEVITQELVLSVLRLIQDRAILSGVDFLQTGQ